MLRLPGGGLKNKQTANAPRLSPYIDRPKIRSDWEPSEQVRPHRNLIQPNWRANEYRYLSDNAFHKSKRQNNGRAMRGPCLRTVSVHELAR
jgi:hypothetical protein